MAKVGQLRRKAGERISCRALAARMIDQLKFYFEQIDDPEIRGGRLKTRCLAFKECADELDNIPRALQRALLAQREGQSCSVISDVSDGLKSMYRVEGFLKGAELMEERRR